MKDNKSLNVGDRVLHIHNYGKSMEETVISEVGGWRTKIENNNIVDKNDILIKTDDPILIHSKVLYKRYRAIQILSHIGIDNLNDEILTKIDEINEMLPKDESERTLNFLNCCGAIEKESSYLSSKINKFKKSND